MVSKIMQRERAAKERQIWIDLTDTFNLLLQYKRGVEMATEYQKAKMLGGLAAAQEIDRIDGVLQEILERLKKMEEVVAYLQADTAPPAKND